MSERIVLKTETGASFDVPVDGSLGLLALGYVGVMLWREKQKAVQIEQQKKSLEETK